MMSFHPFMYSYVRQCSGNNKFQGNMFTWKTSNFFGLRKQIILKKIKFTPNFVGFKQTIIPAGGCFNKKWLFLMQPKTRYFLERAISATINKQIVQRARSDFLQGATSATSNEQILQQVTSDFLQRVTSRFCWRETSYFATSNEKPVNFNE